MNRVERREFLEHFAIALNKTNLEEAEDLYKGFVKFVVNRLKNNEELKCPDFGTFVLSTIKPREIVDPTGKRRRVNSSRFVKFNPDYKVKKYLNNK